MNGIILKFVILAVNFLVSKILDKTVMLTVRRLVEEAARKSNKTGEEKRTFVLNQLNATYLYITEFVPNWLVNLAIESTVASNKVKDASE